MCPTEQRFQTFVTRVRPYRVAVFTNINDPHWQTSCIATVEFLTKVWGGANCIIVPTDGKTITEAFWTILSSYDPDLLYRYQTTGADLRQRATEEFETLVATEIQKYIAATGYTEEQVRNQITEAICDGPLDNFSISDELKSEILIRLAPFHYEDALSSGLPNRQLIVHPIAHGSLPHHPLTRAVDVLRSTERPNYILQIERDVDDDSAPPPLWLAALLGTGNEKFFHDLGDSGVLTQPIRMSEHSPQERIKWGISPRFHEPYPFGISNIALSTVTSVAFRSFDLPTIVVVGDTVKEFCLYYALLRLMRRVLWLPRWFMPIPTEYPDRLVTAVLTAIEVGRSEHNENLSIVSLSVSTAELEELKTAVKQHAYQSSVTVTDVTTELIFQYVKYPMRQYSKGNLGSVTSHQLVESKQSDFFDLPGQFESPLPRTLNPVDPMLHRWLVDITFLDHVIPRHPALGRKVITGANLDTVRAGNGSVSYACPGFLVMGNNIETNIFRPSIRIPGADAIFKIVFAACGYRYERSDKGRYEAETIDKFGDLEQTGFALWSEKWRTLLLKFLDKSPNVARVHDEGVFLGDRRYLNLAAIKKILGSEDLAVEVIDQYVAQKIFYRGYTFVCERCSDASWYSIEEISQTFICRRCRTQQQYTKKSWKAPSEPSWFYRLDEMVYLMLTNNGHVPILALNRMRLRSNGSFLYTPESHITPDGSTKTYLEMDICCIANGRLCIGEAKAIDTLKTKDLTPADIAGRYRDLALKIGASIVVFATSQSQWNKPTREAIAMSFEKHPQIEVVTLNAGALMQ